MKLVVQSDSRIWGGNEKWLLLVSRGLAERGHDVVVSCKPHGEVAERARGAGLRISHRRPGGDADIPRALGFAQLLRRERPDAVLLSAFKRVFWAGWASRVAGVPRVVERLGIEHGLPRHWKYRKAFRDYIDALIVNSSAIRTRWLEAVPWFPPEEVHVVLNGVRPPALNHSPLRAALGIPATAPLLAAAGRLERRKGFDLLLAALSRLADQSVHLAVAGDGEDAAVLRRLAGEVGVADRVHWLGFRPNLDELLVAADVFALPSRREGMANVMLEAMAAGCLVVAADVSGVREAVGARDGRPQAGWIVPPEDVAALAASLNQALEELSSGAAQDRKAELHWRALNWFSPERTVVETERVLLGKSRKR